MPSCLVELVNKLGLKPGQSYSEQVGDCIAILSVRYANGDANQIEISLSLEPSPFIVDETQHRNKPLVPVS